MSVLALTYLAFGVLNNVMVDPIVSLIIAYGLLMITADPNTWPRGERSESLSTAGGQ
jgi:hypothetical protein